MLRYIVLCVYVILVRKKFTDAYTHDLKLFIEFSLSNAAIAEICVKEKERESEINYPRTKAGETVFRSMCAISFIHYISIYLSLQKISEKNCRIPVYVQLR